MLKENPKASGQDDLFRARLDQIIDMGHELARLVDWDALAVDLRANIAPLMDDLASRSG